jgi:phage terminase large subunit
VYWHFFPTLEWGRRALWEAFTPDGRRTLDWIFPGFTDPGREGSIVARKNEQQMFLEFKNGSIWRVMGTDKIESVGAGPIGVVWSEYALGKPKAWNLVRPMLRENGGWSLFITTPRGNNHARKLYDLAKQSGWYTDHKTVYETGQTFFSETSTERIGPDEMMAEERASGMPEALIRQEYLCDWTAANVGSVFGDLMPQASDFDHPLDGVYTSWDLGVSDATAIWFWRLGDGGVDFIDHYEATGKDAAHFIAHLKTKPYEYIRHYLPHDARNRTWVTGVTAYDAIDGFWPNKVEVLPQESLANGIQAGRWLLQCKTRFHARCEEGVEALKAYHYEWDEDRKVLARTPLHDWSSHTADAFRYCASVVKATQLIDAPRKQEKAPEPPMVIVGDDGKAHINRTFNDMAKSAMQRKQARSRV